MKITNIVFVVILVFISYQVLDDIKTEQLYAVTNNQIHLNRILDNAVEDAMLRLVETDSGRDKVINKEEAVNQFFTSLYINMDIMENPVKKQKMKAYIPIIAIIDEDGFYLHFLKEIRQDGVLQCRSSFSEKYFYESVYDNYKIQYTLGDYVKITELLTNDTVEGNFHDLQSFCSLSHMQEDYLFDQERRQVIIHLLKDTITDYINHHNSIARQFGIQYQFSLPLIEQEEWYRTIDDISMIVMFQGLPYGNDQFGYYNRVAIGGARVRKDTKIK